MDFKERWVDVLEKWLPANAAAASSPQEFERRLRDLVAQAVAEARKKSDRPNEEVTTFVLTNGGDRVMQMYRTAESQARHLRDLRQQESKADVHEKVRYLIFRTATALCIGGVILLVAHLANRWGIVLPFRSLPL